MRTCIALFCLLSLFACGAPETVPAVDSPVAPADAGKTTASPDSRPDSGSAAAVDAGTEEPVQIPACLSDPLISAADGGLWFATWLVGGSPCARVSGLPDTGDMFDDELYDSDRDGYLELSRPLPAGDYGISLASENCRTHIVEEVTKPFGDSVLQLVRATDRDVFRCWSFPRINCVDHGGNIYNCWIERIEWFCGLAISVASDGTVSGNGNGSDRIPVACQ